MPLECGHYVLSVPDCDPKWAQSNVDIFKENIA